MKSCEQCGCSPIPRRHIRFCSEACHQLFVHEHKRPLPICGVCKEPFYSRQVIPKFCSYKCAHINRRRTGVGKRTGTKNSPDTTANVSAGQKRRFEWDSAWNKGLHGVQAADKHPMWGKVREDMKGKNNPNWRGGTAKNYNTRLGQDVRHWRSAVYSRDNYTCQACGKTGRHLHADHIKAWADYPELRYEISNGRTLCRGCHYEVTFGRPMPEDSKWGIRKRDKAGVSL